MEERGVRFRRPSYRQGPKGVAEEQKEESKLED